MPVKRKVKSVPKVTIRLNETLGLAQARPLADEILAARRTELTLDASAVLHLGAQCAQVLVAARAAWQADLVSFTIIDPTAGFAEGVRLLGLDEHLQG